MFGGHNRLKTKFSIHFLFATIIFSNTANAKPRTFFNYLNPDPRSANVSPHLNSRNQFGQKRILSKQQLFQEIKTFIENQSKVDVIQNFIGPKENDKKQTDTDLSTSNELKNVFQLKRAVSKYKQKTSLKRNDENQSKDILHLEKRSTSNTDLLTNYMKRRFSRLESQKFLKGILQNQGEYDLNLEQNKTETERSKLSSYVLSRALHLLTKSLNDEQVGLCNKTEESQKGDDFHDHKMQIGKRNEKKGDLMLNNVFDNIIQIKKPSSLFDNKVRKQNKSYSYIYQMSRYILGKALHLITSNQNDESREFLNRAKGNRKEDDSHIDMMRLGKRNGKEKYWQSNNILNNIFRLKKSSLLSENLKSMKQTIENPKKDESIPNISQLRKLSKQQLFQGIKSFIENQSKVDVIQNPIGPKENDKRQTDIDLLASNQLNNVFRLKRAVSIHKKQTSLKRKELSRFEVQKLLKGTVQNQGKYDLSPEQKKADTETNKLSSPIWICGLKITCYQSLLKRKDDNQLKKGLIPNALKLEKRSDPGTDLLKNNSLHLLEIRPMKGNQKLWEKEEENKENEDSHHAMLRVVCLRKKNGREKSNDNGKEDGFISRPT